MDPRLIQYFEDELSYLREGAREFGEEHEIAAQTLGLKTPNDPDPYVERLLEGVAFLGARVRLKMSDQFPEFTQHLLAAVQPHYLAPTPSICIAGFEPRENDPALVDGYVVPRGTKLVATATAHNNAEVTFSTGHDVRLFPLKITEVEYLASRTAVASIAAGSNIRAEAGLRIRIEPTGAIPLENLKIRDLAIYLDGSEAVPGELYRQLIGETLAVFSKPAAYASAVPTPLGKPAQCGFESNEALLPAEERSFRGYRILTEYFACPERFLFVTLADMDRAFANAQGGACDIFLLFERKSDVLAGALSPANFRLFATPAINLFEKQLGRVAIDGNAHEFHLVPDRTRPLEFEVYRLLDVNTYFRDDPEARPAAPLYAMGALLYDWNEAIFYVPRLALRKLSSKRRKLLKRGDYIGTETWLSLTAPGNPERMAQVKELAVRALVTNRDLGGELTFRGAEHFQPPEGPVRTVSVLRSPTKPRPPLGLGDSAWRVIGHLTPNYATLAQSENSDPSLLRDHLALYGPRDDAALRRQIDGIMGVNSRPIVRRIPGQGQLAVARGSQITLTLDDQSYDNSRLFLFSAIVERFLSDFVSINSFTETIIKTPAEGAFAKWPARIGRRHTV